MSLIRQTIEYYRELKRKKREKDELLSASLNYRLLEELLNKCAVNPGLVIEINLKTGDKLLLKTKPEEFYKPLSSLIDGREVIE